MSKRNRNKIPSVNPAGHPIQQAIPQADARQAPVKGSGKHIELLDYVRATAILAVLLHHSFRAVYGHDLPWHGWFRDFSAAPISSLCFLPFDFGDMGVAIFFVVSGFCIHLSFQQQGRRWGGFFIRRIFRIYPAYLATLIYFGAATYYYMKLFGMEFLTDQADWMNQWTHAFLIHNFFPSTLGGISGSFWSLAIEAQLYLLYPALLALVARLGWRRAMVLLAGGELLIRGLAGPLILTGSPANTTGEYLAWLLANSPLCYWFSWALGARLCDAFLKNQPLPFRNGFPFLWLALTIASYFVKPLSSFRFLLAAVLTAVVMSKFLSGARTTIRVPAFSLKILRNIGLWSYSIYLLHQPLLGIYNIAIGWFLPGGYQSGAIALLLLLATWLLIIPLSVLWYKLFEQPGIVLGKRLIKKPDARRGAKVEPIQSARSGWTGMAMVRHGLTICALLAFVLGNFWVQLKFTPQSAKNMAAATVHNNSAWSLATSSDAAKRNGALAVELAEDACELTHYQRTVMVGTLAAAYAEAGRFDEAIATGQKACALAQKNGETDLLIRNQQLVKLYQAHQAYHEPAAARTE